MPTVRVGTPVPSIVVTASTFCVPYFVPCFLVGNNSGVDGKLQDQDLRWHGHEPVRICFSSPATDIVALLEYVFSSF